MTSIKAHMLRVAKQCYRRMPEGSKDVLSATFHGESPLQRTVADRLRSVGTRVWGTQGEGTALTGPIFGPRLVKVVDTYDCWEHLGRLADEVVGTLRSAGVSVYRIPNQARPLLVVPSDCWDAAWAALARGLETGGFWAQGAHFHHVVRDLKGTPNEATVWLYEYLMAPNGSLIGDARVRLRLTCWERVTEEGLERPDGGTHAVGTVLSGKVRNSFAAYLSPAVMRHLDDVESGAAQWPAASDLVTEPVDLVYTWVDGSDPEWNSKRQRFFDGNGTTPDSNVASRFVSRDELKYSLRSVAMYASWVNKIYLVTDGQKPSWINEDQSKLVLVDHRDIFDEDELPVFNSHAIESRLHRIPGLADLFIYMNDDVFFGRPLRPESFFHGDSVVKFYPSRARIDPGPPTPEDVSVTSAAKNNRHLIEKTFGRTYTSKLKHTPHPQLRSLLTEMEERFPEVFAGNVAARFRSHGDHSIVSGLAQRYGEVTGRALVGSLRYDYADISRPDLKRLLARWLRSRANDVFCLNDTAVHEVDEDERDAIVASFLEAYFPVPSPFET